MPDSSSFGLRKEGLAPDSSSFGRYGAVSPFHADFPGPEGAMPDFGDIIEGPNNHSSRQTFLSLEPCPFPDQFGTAGFDIIVGGLIAWSDTVADNVTRTDLCAMEHKFLEYDESFVLQPDEDGQRVYYIVSSQALNNSRDLEILTDSKSTTGRVGCMSHNAGRTDQGHLITIVQPYAFPIKVMRNKTKLSQALVRYKGTPYMTHEEILSGKDITFEGDGVSLQRDLTSRGLLMKFDTKKVYRAKKCSKPIDMDAKGTIDWKDYFDVLDGNSAITLDKKTLYLLGSLGVIGLDRACGVLSREMEVLTGTGAWSHFAGIFQPGFKGGITMEVYSHSKRKISSGDKSGVVLFDKVEGEISEDIGKGYKGSYQGQTPPLLPKMFKQE